VTINKVLLKKLSPEKRALLAKKLVGKKMGQIKTRQSVENQIQTDTENRYVPFPLTELQQAYWIGRSGAYELGDVSGHSYIEIENNFDLPRLNKAWQLLIQRHDMLRAVVSKNGMQRILKEVPFYEIIQHDLTGMSSEEQETNLKFLRERISHQILDSELWPLFNFEAAIISDNRIRLFLGLDAIIIDGWSLAILFKEWTTLYQNLQAELSQLDLTFRDYVIAEKKLPDTQNYKRAEEYWKKRLPNMPTGPILPFRRTGSEQQRFFRRHGFLDPVTYNKLKTIAKQHGITSTVVLMAAYCHVISVWSNSTDFTLSIPQFNRMPLHPQVNNIIGEAASFNLLEVKLEANHSFIECAKKLQTQLWNDLDNNYFSGVKVLRELSQLHNQASGVLMPVIFTGSPHDPDGNDGFITTVAADLGEVVYAINQTPQVLLDNHISEQNDGLSVDWDTVEQIFPEGMQDDMFNAYMQLLHNLGEDQSTWSQNRADMAASLVPAKQLQKREYINSKQSNIPEVLVQDLFAEQVSLHADKTVVITSKKTLSYQQLYDMTNQWAHRLREFDIKPNTLIAIVMEKGWEQPLAAHAVLQAGAAYAPMDANQPDDRLNKLLIDSQATIVLTQSWLADRFNWPEHINLLFVDEEDVSQYDCNAPAHIQTPDDLAYVLYTSGSTGNPRGVMIHHRGVVNALLCTLKTYDIGTNDSVFALTALHHDLSIFDVFGITAAGGSMVIPDADNRRDPDHWSQLLKQHQVTIWNSVPAMMDMMLEYADTHPDSLPASLRWAFLGGDWIPITLPDRLQSQLENAHVISTGGPTETTLWNIWYPVESVHEDWTSIPYGTPIDNTKYYVLNDVLESCPDWVTGELCCSAVGLAKGYWQDEEKTREKFFYHPRTGERMYRTGDLGRYVPNGYIEFIGRSDFQIKIQGQRIETGEIEAALIRHKKIIAAIVTVLNDAGKKKRLVAYLLCVDNQIVNQSEINTYLLSKLPDYMVPTGYMQLKELPLTANGKVDRRLLPDFVDVNKQASETKPQSASDITSRLIRIAEDILQQNQIQPDDNLLSLGANSIDMVRIGNQLEKEFGFRPRMDEIFRLQTLNALADYCRENTTDSTESESNAPTGLDTIDARLKAVINNYEQIRDPVLRDEFKLSRPGIRHDEDKTSIALEKPDDEILKLEYDNRYSHRRFALKPVPFSQFSEFIRCLYLMEINGKNRYLYPSPGGLYPTQAYLHIKPGRVEGITAGTYYYNPEDHKLVTIKENVDLHRNIHVPFVNTPMFDEAAFSIFLVADMAAVAPSYGELSVFFVKLEAGVMAELLESSARNSGLAICQTGGVNFEKIKHLFDLTDGHLFLHSLLAGPIYDKEKGYDVNNIVLNEDPQIRANNLMRRVMALTEDEAKMMLIQQKQIVKSHPPS
jgi:amino acid adenylation domain-containing protein